MKLLITFLFGSLAFFGFNDDTKSLQQNSVNTISRVSVLFMYSNYSDSTQVKYMTSQSEVNSRVTRVVSEANKILSSSSVNMTFDIAGVEEVKLKASKLNQLTYMILNSSRLSQVNKFTYPTIKPIFDLRFQKKADVVVYIDVKNKLGTGTNGANRFGGKYNPYVRINSGDFNSGIFIHEICHLFGLTHEMGATLPYDKTKPGFRTIMAVNCAQTMGANHKQQSNIFTGKSSYKNGKQYYSECNWDAVSILNRNASAYSSWSEQVSYGATATYDKVPTQIDEISVVDNCTTWAIDEFNRLWIWDGYQWDDIETFRRFKNVAAKNYEVVFLVDTEGTIITYDNYTKVFGMISAPEKALKVTTNTSGKIFMLGESGNIFEWRLTNGRVEWVIMPSINDTFKDVEITKDNQVWALHTDGSVMQYQHQNWVVRGKTLARALSIGNDGTLAFIANDNTIYISINAGFDFKPIQNNVESWCNCSDNRKKCESDINSNRGNKVSVFNKNRIWVLSSEMVYKYVAGNGFQEVYEYGQIHKPKYSN